MHFTITPPHPGPQGAAATAPSSRSFLLGRPLRVACVAGVASVVSALALGTAHAQVASCSVTTVPLSFGSYDVSSVAPLITSSKIEVRCAKPTSLTLGIDGGSSAAISPNGRTLRHLSSTDVLNYNIYQDASLSTVWGNAMTSAGRSLSVSTALTVFAYGALPAGQDVRFGEYRDVLSVVVMP